MASQLAHPFVVISPVYNDWTSAEQLLEDLDRLPVQSSCHVVFVDDGSCEECPPFDPPSGRVDAVSVLRLRRNMGHQRAIAIGLAYAHQELEFEAAVIMDCDGEDKASDVPRLLEACEAGGWSRAVFAERAKRQETLTFRLFYLLYLASFRILTGFVERTGNFSVLPIRYVSRVVCAPELWLHYASAMRRLRLPCARVPLARGKRYHGRSKMRFADLALHGLQAIAVHRDLVAVRIFFYCLVGTLVLASAVLVVVWIRMFTSLAIPGWATNVAGVLALLLGQAVTLVLVSIFMLLGSRTAAEVIPARDYQIFVEDVQVVVRNGRTAERALDKVVSDYRYVGAGRAGIGAPV